MNLENKISIIGGGAWGTTIAKLLSEASNNIKLWCYEKAVADSINSTHENVQYLNGVRLPDSLTATTDIKTAVQDAWLVVLAVPSEHYELCVKGIVPYITTNTLFLSLTKGLESGSCTTLTSILKKQLLTSKQYTETSVDSYILAMSGPNLAGEIARKVPSSTVVACLDHNSAQKVQKILMRKYFRAYTTTDINGIQIGGALKNIMAIAAGISFGLGYGSNTEAALMTRGLSEMLRLCPLLNARPETLTGLSGLGDLIATASSTLSRNRSFGYDIAHGADPIKIIKKSKKVIEGAKVVVPVVEFCRQHNIDAPISEAIYNIIYKGLDPTIAVTKLMSRKPKQED